MSIAETAELVAEMNLKGDFPRQAVKMQKGLDGLNARTKSLQQGLGKVGKGLAKGFKTGVVAGGAAVGFLAYNVMQGLESLAELEDVTKATGVVLKSTGGVAKVTAGRVRELAEEYEDLTTVDDKVIQGAENLLLTFTNVRKKAFEPTLAAALDMSEALDMDLNASVKTLGKALNDPAAGLSRLTRLGVTFTAQEQKKIKALQESGRTFEAQQVILGKLNRLYGGRAQAAASGYRGSLNRLKDGVEELQQSLAGPLIRPLTRVTNKLAKFAKTEDVQRGIRGIGQAFASLFESPIDTNAANAQDALGKGLAAAVTASPFERGLNLVKEAFKTVEGLNWNAIRGGLDQTFQVAAKAVDLFKGLPPELQTALVTLLAANKLTGGLVASGLKDIAGLALKSLTTITAANVTVVGKNVTSGGGGVPVPGQKTGKSGGGLGGFLGGGLGGILTAIGLSGFGSQQDTYEVDDPKVQRAIHALDVQHGRSNVIQTVGNGLQTAVAGSLQVIKDHEALQARLAPVQNDILNGIATGTTTIAEDGKTANSIFQRQATVTEAALPALVAKMEATRGQVAGTVPVLGTIRSAVAGVQAAIRQKDLSVRLAVTTNVTATTVAQGVSRVTSGNRVVYD